MRPFFAILILLSVGSTYAEDTKTQTLDLNVMLRQWSIMGPFPKESEQSTGIDEFYFPREATLKAGHVRIYDNEVFKWQRADTPRVDLRNGVPEME